MVILLLLFSPINFFAQNKDINLDKKDSMGMNDSTKLKKETPPLNPLIGKEGKDSLKVDSAKAKIDTVKPNLPLRTHGSVFQLNSNIYKTIGKEDIQFQNYSLFSDIMDARLPAFPLSLGYPGGFNSFSLFGGSPRDISVTFNNRPLNDPEFGSFNLDQMSPEFMEKAEILVGSDAVILSDNSSGALINLQEIRYDTKKPYTRLWYSMETYDLIQADGIYSQNFVKNWNFTFGFRSMSSAGRFANSWLDAWNVRGILRWNASDQTSISLSENFTNQGTGTNGGNDITQYSDIYDDISAVQKFPTLNERVFRHDITLTFDSRFTRKDTTARHVNDSTKTTIEEEGLEGISASLYFSHILWNEHFPLEMLPAGDSSEITKHIDRYFGASVKYEQNLFNLIFLRFGGNAQYDIVEKSFSNDSLKSGYLAGFGQAQIPLFEHFELSGGLRLKYFENNVTFSSGVRGTYKLSDHTKIFADYSLSQRQPTPSEGLNLKNELHSLALLQGEWISGETKVIFGAFYRIIGSPILSIPDSFNITLVKQINGDTRVILGSNLSFDTRLIKQLYIDASMQVYYSKTNGVADKRFPGFMGDLRVYYEFAKGASILRIGISGGMMTSFIGEWFDPINRTYTPANYESGLQWKGLNGFVEARLGIAYVKLSWDNLLERGYYYVPFYPQLDRTLHLSVAWPFLD
ncbi:MAG: TonB-dependent receptor [FCB group bacterium]